jgi:WLM domain
MIFFLYVIVLFIVQVLVCIFHKEPDALTQLKQRYWATLDMLRQTGDPMWKDVLRPSIITGMRDWTRARGPIGSNVNKGYEIYICLDGKTDVNSAMYVLIHELAHMSVPEYDHTTKFWENFKKLKDLCISAGLYTAAGERGYCGDTIRD